MVKEIVENLVRAAVEKLFSMIAEDNLGPECVFGCEVEDPKDLVRIHGSLYCPGCASAMALPEKLAARKANCQYGHLHVV